MRWHWSKGPPVQKIGRSSTHGDRPAERNILLDVRMHFGSSQAGAECRRDAQTVSLGALWDDHIGLYNGVPRFVGRERID